jgi:hypothetical protein
VNQRIRELIRLADVHILPDDSEYGHCIIGLEKFAEFIVRECALICESRPGPGDDVRSRQHCSLQILEHFGVEL